MVSLQNLQGIRSLSKAFHCPGTFRFFIPYTPLLSREFRGASYPLLEITRSGKVNHAPALAQDGSFLRPDSRVIGIVDGSAVLPRFPFVKSLTGFDSKLVASPQKPFAALFKIGEKTVHQVFVGTKLVRHEPEFFCAK